MRSGKVEHKRPFTQKNLKEAAQKGAELRSRSHAAGLPPPPLTEIGLGTHRLTRLEDYRYELQRVYKALSAGQIDESTAHRLVWMLDNLRRAKSEEDDLELMKTGVADDAPFAGLTIIGEGRPAPLPYSPKKV